MHSFHCRWHCRTTSNKEPWYTVHGLNPIHVTTDVRSHSMESIFTQMLINGSKCCVMWVVLPARVRGSVHSCCLSTVSTCLAIHEHHLGLFLEWIPYHCASVLLNSHYLQHTQSTLQVLRDCRQCHLPWKLCIFGHGDMNFDAPFLVRNHPLKFVGGLKTHSVQWWNKRNGAFMKYYSIYTNVPRIFWNLAKKNWGARIIWNEVGTTLPPNKWSRHAVRSEVRITC